MPRPWPQPWPSIRIGSGTAAETGLAWAPAEPTAPSRARRAARARARPLLERRLWRGGIVISSGVPPPGDGTGPGSPRPVTGRLPAAHDRPRPTRPSVTTDSAHSHDEAVLYLDEAAARASGREPAFAGD